MLISITMYTQDTIHMLTGPRVVPFFKVGGNDLVRVFKNVVYYKVDILRTELLWTPLELIKTFMSKRTFGIRF